MPLTEELLSRITALTEKIAPRVVAFRRELHSHPELSGCETETAARIAAALRSAGMDVTENVGRTGVVGLVEGAHPGPCVAGRADMDGLPLTERTGLPFASTVRTEYKGRQVGVMHACGHDVHTAILYGAGLVLAKLGDHFGGSVKLIFQPSEEDVLEPGLAGAQAMIRDGALENPTPEAIYAFHIDPVEPAGRIGLCRGVTHAAVDEFIITVRGKGTHGSAPWRGVDTMVLASRVILALQTIVSRQINARQAAVVSVGSINGGAAFNVIPETVTLTGTIRSFDKAVQAQIKEAIPQIVAGIHASAGLTFDRERDYRHIPHTPVGSNTESLTKRAIELFERILPAGAIYDFEASMGGEDFAFYKDDAQLDCVFCRLGSRPEDETGPVTPLHSPEMMVDEDCIPFGIRLMVCLIVDHLRRDEKTD